MVSKRRIISWCKLGDTLYSRISCYSCYWNVYNVLDKSLSTNHRLAAKIFNKTLNNLTRIKNRIKKRFLNKINLKLFQPIYTPRVPLSSLKLFQSIYTPRVPLSSLKKYQPICSSRIPVIFEKWTYLISRIWRRKDLVFDLRKT